MKILEISPDLATLPQELAAKFTSYYNGAPAARLSTASETIEMELSLTNLKRSYETKQVHRKDRGRLIREFVIRLLS